MTYSAAKFTNKRTLQQFFDVVNSSEISQLSKNYIIVKLADFNNFNDAVKYIRTNKLK